MIERKIIIGLIVSTEYLKRIRPIWDVMLLESSTAKLLANWAIEYYDKYKVASNKNFETIFYQKLDEGLDKDIAEEIEEDILPDLSEESQSDFNFDYLIDETTIYLKSRQLSKLSGQIGNLIENESGKESERIKEAEQIAKDFKPVSTKVDESLDLSKPESLERVRKAYAEASEPLIKWPKQLGEFWNHQFVAGGFISFLAPEKRGKTFILLEIIMRALRQGRKVAFFQAGDMNEAEQIKRICTYLLKKSHLEKYCQPHYEVVRDCILNQQDLCERPERECDFGIFSDKEKDEIQLLEKDELIEAYKDIPEYESCYNCKDYDRRKLGTPWIKYNKEENPSTIIEVEKAVKDFFQKYNRQFKMSTHASGTLSFDDINRIQDRWESQEGFVADVVLSDYMDIMRSTSLSKNDRNRENQKWIDARQLSQTKRGGVLPLFISPTQADAAAYRTYRLKLDNFSEDKRKYGHVTAMYGLNQDPLGREKKLRLLRINEMSIREGDFSNDNEVTLLMNLFKGRPYRQAYFSN